MVNDNAELDISGGILVNNAFTINSSGTAVKTITGPNTIGGAITLLANTTLDTLAGSNLLLSGTIDDGGQNFGLTKLDTGSLLIIGTNTYGGGTTIQSGTLLVESTAATGTTGTIVVAGGATLRQAVSTYNLPAGGLQLGAQSTYLTISPVPSTVNGPISLVGDSAFSINIGSLTVNGPISGAHGFTKFGSATLDLTATSAYTGATTVMAGSLQVEGDISTSSGVSLQPGRTLSGDGTVGPVTSSGGILSPGDSPGILHSGSVTLDANSTFTVSLNGTTAGTGYSQLVASGAIRLGGATLQATLGYTPTVGDQLTILKNNSGAPVVGTFAGLPEGSIIVLGTYSFRLSYQGGLSGQDIVLTNVVPTTTVVGSNVNPLVYGQ
jgi:autotransporter-associated beta strand protein